jgi:hypothetical protein
VNLPQFHSFWPQNLIIERCSYLVQFSGEAAMILALWFELRFSCHRLHAVRTCPIDVSTLCSSFIRLRPILLNIQSICPYLLKSPRIFFQMHATCPDQHSFLDLLTLTVVIAWSVHTALSRFMGVSIDGVWIGEWIYEHESELQAITAPPLISIIDKSPQHPLSFFQPSVFASRFLATASNSGYSSASRVQVLSSQPPVQNCRLNSLLELSWL